MKVQIKKLIEGVEIPSYAKAGDAAFDLTATSVNITDKFIEYGTGLAVKIPEGYAGLLMPRSSNSKFDMALCNSVGLIDSGYTGELKFRYKVSRNQITVDEQGKLIINNSADFTVYVVGDRIGQFMIIPYPTIEFEEVEELEVTERGADGFGSTGK